MDRFQGYLDANQGRFLDELVAFCAQPSIAARGIGMEEAAGLVVDHLERLGATAQRFDVGGPAPILYAELGQGPRTLLVYNHYDVQPPDPLDEWQTPPFEPAVREGRIYARGVADDKGDLLCRLQAIEAYQEAIGPLPLRVRFLVEGEEEVGSPNLEAFVDKHRHLLQADGCLWETGQKDARRRVVLELGVKGICYLELSCKTAASDLHSMWGGIVPNAAWRLVWALDTLKDPHGRILVDGLMDYVQPPTRAERAHLAALPFDTAKIKADFGFDDYVGGLQGVDLLVKHFYEPTCTLCGLKSGYLADGAKTVLPNAATAKVDFRLVPDLTPELVLELVRMHLQRRGFDDIEVTLLNGLLPARSRRQDPFVGACVEAARATYGQEPLVYPNSPGSGPMYTVCRGMPAVMAGVAHANSHLHAPNENIYVQDYLEGIRFVGELIQRYGQ